MSTATDNLIASLAGVQQTMGYSDEEFAELLGISRPLWIMTRSGQMPVGMKLLAGTTRRFPGLKEQVLAVIGEYKKAEASA